METEKATAYNPCARQWTTTRGNNIFIQINSDELGSPCMKSILSWDMQVQPILYDLTILHCGGLGT